MASAVQRARALARQRRTKPPAQSRRGTRARMVAVTAPAELGEQGRAHGLEECAGIMGRARTSPVSSMEVIGRAEPEPTRLAILGAVLSLVLWLVEVAVVCWLL